MNKIVSVGSLCGIMQTKTKTSDEIVWQPKKWATDCNLGFERLDENRINIQREKCPLLCQSTSNCTHFFWTRGVCYIKHGLIDIENATSYISICGTAYTPSIFKVNHSNYTANTICDIFI